MSTRLGDNEQLLNEEAEAGPVIKEFSAIAAEAAPKWEAGTIDISRGFASTMSVDRALQRELTIHNSLFLSESSTPVEDDGGEEDGMVAFQGMLKCGQAFISQFGWSCPVCLRETGSLAPADVNLSCVFLGRLFHFESEKRRQKVPTTEQKQP